MAAQSYKINQGLPNIALTDSAKPPPKIRNAPRTTVYLGTPAPQPRYREEWRTRYYGDHFTREPVLVPAGAPGDGGDGLGKAIRDFLTWLIG